MLRFVIAFVGVLVLSTHVVSSAQPLPNAATESRPNILFIFADDYSYEALGMLGKVDVETPNLDRLARRGALFTHAYNMGSWSGAVCIASRTMLVTGRTVWHAHEPYQQTSQEAQKGRLWPQLLSQAGYRTYMTGKWHVKAKAEEAFDVVSNIRAGMPRDQEVGYERPIAGQPDAWDPADPKFGGYWTGGKHWSEVVADDAIGFLDDAPTRGQPFFIYAAFNAPHDPRQSPAEYLARYPLESITLPSNFLAIYPQSESIGCSSKLRDERLAPTPRTEFAVKTHRREYFALITHMDAQIGRILDHLDASLQAQNTWIFFTADHGLAVGHHGLMGKQNMYDHSLRVPFIVVGPGVEPGTRIKAPIYLQDIMPTSLELAGAKVPNWVEFHSLLPHLEDPGQAKPREEIYGGYLELQRAILHDGYKLIVYPKAKVVKLYHLDSDPDEQRDLASDPAQKGRIGELFARLQRLQKTLDDPLDLTSAFPSL